MVSPTIDTQRGVILAVAEQAVDLLRLIAQDADMPEPRSVLVRDDHSVSLHVRNAEEVNRWANWLGGYVRTRAYEGRIQHLVHVDFASLHVEVFAVETPR